MSDYFHHLLPGNLFADRFRIETLSTPAPGAARYRVRDERTGLTARLTILEPAVGPERPELSAVRTAAASLPARWQDEAAAECGEHGGLVWVVRPARPAVSVLDLLRAQRQLSVEGAFAVLTEAARAGDRLRGGALPGLFLSPRLLKIEVEDSVPPLAEFLRPPLARWPAWRLAPEPVFAPLHPAHAEDSLLLAAEDRRGARVIAALFCELMGRPGARASQTAPPVLPALGEDGSAVLARAWTRPQDFATLRDFVEQMESLVAPTRRTTAPTYTPKPIPTGAVQMPPELQPLGERLAEHIHDLWAQQRISEGWKWGPKRNDARREHQDLIPYDDLTEGEKEYDRRTATGTLRAILALGFRILPPESGPSAPGQPPPR